MAHANEDHTGLPDRAGAVAVPGQEGVLGSFGIALTVAALLGALLTFVILGGLTPIEPTTRVVVVVFGLNGLLILTLFGLVVWEVRRLWLAQRRGVAAVRLHRRILRWFGLIASLPAIIVSIVAIMTLERGLDPWFTSSIRDVLQESTIIAKEYNESQCRTMARETDLMAVDLNRAHRFLFEANRDEFRRFMDSRATFLGFHVAMLIASDGSIIERIEKRPVEGLSLPNEDDLKAASDGQPWCLIPQNGNVYRTLVKLNEFPDAFLVTARPVDPRALLFPQAAERANSYYQALDARKNTLQAAFAVMFGLIALVVLVSSVWLGLIFANRLVSPVRTLIHATDQVSSGNYYVQVPVRSEDGDLGHLGQTFNNMTSELRRQRDRLVAASELIDKRRRFTEAVLAGVSPGVIGLDTNGRITVINPAAERLLGVEAGKVNGRLFVDVVPEFAALRDETGQIRDRRADEPIAFVRNGVERLINVRVTSERANQPDRGVVVTLEDITDLVSAQRSSAWADVARRIAHEIKNPLTPIQLSAERIRRKYGKVIVEDREVFDQCTQTIIRQVDDIKQMVDEFASFARMPKPTLQKDDITEVARQVVFLMRVGNPGITFIEELPAAPVPLFFDRRLIGQALTNIVKNATEGILALNAEERPVVPTISLALRVEEQEGGPGRVVIDVTDNGKGFPVENRNRLLEPYMTTREGGTGLGLPIVAKIFDDHGGGLNLLDNPQERGARVQLWLPIAPEQNRKAAS